MFDREALLLGLVPPAALALIGVTVRLPEPLGVVGVLSLLLGGPAGGYVAGTLAAGDRRRRAVHGLVCGALVGLPLGGTLVYAIHESEAPRHTAVWWIHYAVATTTPPSVVVAYGYYILAGIGVAAALWYALGAAAAAGATGDRGPALNVE
ncbi:hypothetical protein G9464_19420 [Halostella sp. JP-L12]|uniref:hypothetical protein n=1 Tax=Halostella TaxID=1843185 RepID=UPI000EF827D4|nr:MULTISPECIES: hypothetical protein [Halostella]NHN49743.1 hypothetical protein [Halostella sp. JP-L12]